MSSRVTPAGEFSVAMTEELDRALRRHLRKPDATQEDLTFAIWRPSRGRRRLTAVIHRLVLPESDERILQGNVAFTAEYLVRALGELEEGESLALIHSHLGPGWQDMSDDDIVAERDRLAGAVFGRTELPVVGLTSGTDGSWSARCWNRIGPGVFARQSATHVRVVGHAISWTFHPTLRPATSPSGSQAATVSVWGERAQADLVRCRVGIVGLGSVGSLVCESLARLGIRDVALIDHDRIEERNLDRTAGALPSDIQKKSFKVAVAARHARAVATAREFRARELAQSLLTTAGLSEALDCDVLFSCVDRPWPRHLLNSIAYAHLIPVVDGGVLAAVDRDRLLHADWRIHLVGPSRPCMVCVGALDLGDVGLDMGGKLDEPDYVRNLPPERAGVISRRNVYPFSMSVAAHELLQFIGCTTSNQRVGGSAAQFYHCYPGVMECLPQAFCAPACAYHAITATAADLSGNLQPPAATGSEPPNIRERIRRLFVGLEITYRDLIGTTDRGSLAESAPANSAQRAKRYHLCASNWAPLLPAAIRDGVFARKAADGLPNSGCEVHHKRSFDVLASLRELCRRASRPRCGISDAVDNEQRCQCTGVL